VDTSRLQRETLVWKLLPSSRHGPGKTFSWRVLQRRTCSHQLKKREITARPPSPTWLRARPPVHPLPADCV